MCQLNLHHLLHIFFFFLISLHRSFVIVSVPFHRFCLPVVGGGSAHQNIETTAALFFQDQVGLLAVYSQVLIGVVCKGQESEGRKDTRGIIPDISWRPTLSLHNVGFLAICWLRTLMETLIPQSSLVIVPRQ